MSAYLQASLNRVWSPIGQTPVVYTSPQRDSVKFYGALDVETGYEIALALPKMDGDNTIHFLQHILSCIPHRPILLVWDRATWHKGRARLFIEAHPYLDMIYFPPACPDLNPQEHVWKQTREAVDHLHDYRHVSALRLAFQNYLEHTLFSFNWIDKYLPVHSYESAFT